MSLFLFSKQIIDMLYKYRFLDYFMVGVVLFMIAYQLLLTRPVIKERLTIVDGIVILLGILISIHFAGNLSTYPIYVKVMSAFLLFLLGRICSERIEECGQALVISGYLIIYVNFAHRILALGADLLGSKTPRGDFYYYDTDMAYAMVLALIFIAFLGKNTILKLITLFLVVPYMVFFSEAGIQAILLLVVYLILLIYIVEMMLRKKKIGSTLLIGMTTILLGTAIFIHLPVFGLVSEQVVQKFFKNVFLDGSNMLWRYERWKEDLQAFRQMGWNYRLFGRGLDCQIDSMYLKILCSVGIVGAGLAILFMVSFLWYIRYVDDRRIFYLVLTMLILWLGSGVIGNSMESTQMSWFPFMYMGIVVSSGQCTREK